MKFFLQNVTGYIIVRFSTKEVCLWKGYFKYLASSVFVRGSGCSEFRVELPSRSIAICLGKFVYEFVGKLGRER